MTRFRACSAVVLLLLAGLAQAGEPFQTFEVEPGTVLPGRCHMGECVWTQILASRTSVRPNREITVAVTERVGTTRQGGGAGRDNDIQWGEQGTSTVTCSYTRPRVAFVADGETHEHLLTLSPQGTVFGYQVHSTLTYFRACHNLTLDEGGIDAAIARFGYDVIADE